MAVRSRRFFGPVEVAASTNALLYTVPAGRTARFSLLVVSQIGTGTGNAVVRVNSSTSNPVYLLPGIGVSSTYRLADELVLNPGDELRFSSPASLACWLSGYGSLLDGEPV